ncbi:venom protease isoform X1 [Procambarus clarkii]|uniref:venom protease isoform X1 n=1 Tax=Procambarus clarkii TaxID=6728 RepID=UPI003743B101
MKGPTSSTLLLLLASVSLATVASALAQGSCTPRTGGRGRCVEIRSCPSVLRTFRLILPVFCNHRGRFLVVCCPAVGDDQPAATEDISPPIVNFQCGQNRQQTFNLLLRSFAQASILRPESESSEAPGGGIVTRAQKPPGRAGVPQDALAVHLTPRSLVQRQSPKEAAAAALERDTASRMVTGGVRATKNSWPWMALLGERNGGSNTWFCAGVLINNQWVLSALHCLTQATKTVQVVRLGEHDYNDDNDGAAHEDFGVAESILHPEYLFPQSYHDLALIKLDRKIVFKPYINPVCLAWGGQSSHSLVGQNVTLAGWGNTEFAGFPSSVLQEVNVTVFQSSECDQSYSTLLEYPTTWPQGIGQETVCAGDRNGGRDACQGDSGGPIVTRNPDGRFTLAGIVSRGYGCGLKDFPGLYVNLHHPPYLAWIKKIAFN